MPPSAYFFYSPLYLPLCHRYATVVFTYELKYLVLLFADNETTSKMQHKTFAYQCLSCSAK